MKKLTVLFISVCFLLPLACNKTNEEKLSKEQEIEDLRLSIEHKKSVLISSFDTEKLFSSLIDPNEDLALQKEDIRTYFEYKKKMLEDSRKGISDVTKEEFLTDNAGAFREDAPYRTNMGKRISIAYREAKNNPDLYKNKDLFMGLKRDLERLEFLTRNQ